MTQAETETLDRALRAKLRRGPATPRRELTRYLVSHSRLLLPEFPFLVGLDWDTQGVCNGSGDLLFRGEGGYAAVQVNALAGRKNRRSTARQARLVCEAARVLYGPCLPLVYTTVEHEAEHPPRHPAIRAPTGVPTAEELRDRHAVGLLAAPSDLEVMTHGSGPLPEAAFDELLTDLDIMVFGLGVQVAGSPDAWVVVGSRLTTEKRRRLAQCLEAVPHVVPVTQEEFLVLLGGGDPTPRPVAPRAVMNANARGFTRCPECGVSVSHLDRHRRRAHGPGSRRVRHPDGQIPAWRWPKTPNADAGVGPFGDGAWPQVGMLKAMGYSVAKDVDRKQRRAALKATFEGPLPRVHSPAYVKEWGADSSSARLKKLAWTIASLANNAHRKSGRTRAVAAWSSDLDWLRANFWEQRHSFGWPELKHSKRTRRASAARRKRKRKRR